MFGPKTAVRGFLSNSRFQFKWLVLTGIDPFDTPPDQFFNILVI